MADSAPRSVCYAFETHVVQGAPCLKVTLTFLGEASGVTELLLPSEWGGLVSLQEGIRNLRALTPEAVVHDSAEPHLKTILYPPSVAICLEYYVFNAPEEVDNSFKPILTPTWFHLLGHEFFACPKWDTELVCSVTLDWNSLPREWTVANSLGAECRRQEVLVSLDDLCNAVYVSGDYRMLQLDTHSTFLAIRGAWQFSDEALSDLAKQILDMEKSFWGDDSLPFFLITVTPREEGGFAGVGLKDSFLVLVAPDAGLDDFKGLLAHELFHRWNPGQMLLIGPRENYGWFFEGFTNFYVRRLLLRAGLISNEDFLREYNEVFFGYYSSPFLNFTPQQIQDAYQDKTMSLDRRFYALAYQKGEILALRWDSRIRAASQGTSSLDDVMHGLLAIAKVSEGQVSEANLIALCRSHGYEGVSEDLQLFIDAGNTVDVDADALGLSTEMRSVERALFDPGFDYSLARATKTIQSVQKGSRAFQAGLRDGQEYMSDNYRFDPGREAFVIVKENGQKRTIKYYPEGLTAPIPQCQTKNALKKETS